MGDKAGHDTGIEWTHVPGYKGATWNPVRGCVKISPGCKNCYAETFAERWRGVIMPNGKPHAYHQGFDLRLVPEKLDEPLRKTKPHAYFVNSMSDLHQDGVSHDFLRVAYAVMQAASRHIFMVLTKRAFGMQVDLGALRMDRGAVPRLPSGQALPRYMADGAPVPKNIWLGVSVEDRKYGLPRVDVLRTIPAAVRFLSVEPLLEDLGDIDLTGIHWVIVGGESGHGARPFDLAWARRVVRQCQDQGVPVFVKQYGENAVTHDTTDIPDEEEFRRATTAARGSLLNIRTKARKGGDMSEWPVDLRIREWPRCVVTS